MVISSNELIEKEMKTGIQQVTGYLLGYAVSPHNEPIVIESLSLEKLND